MSESPSPNLALAGWREDVALPAWGIRRIRAKLDTGARTSAIHVAKIKELDEGRLRFQVVTREGSTRKTKWVEATRDRDAAIKPSSGDLQERPVVRTVMRLGEIEREIEISLVCRAGMLCRMLLGRTALAEVAAVDPSRKFLLTRRSTPNDRTDP